MPGLGGRQRGAHGLLVAHLADQDHVRVLAQDARIAGEALGVLPTSRWLMIDRLSRCRYSIGSSSVTMCSARVELMWSIIAASVVDLPEPVVPVSRMIPRCSRPACGSPGQAEVLDRAHLEGDHAADDRDGAALAEGVDAKAGDAGQLE